MNPLNSKKNIILALCSLFLLSVENREDLSQLLSWDKTVILEDLDEKIITHNTPSIQDAKENKTNYTINFDNVPILQYLKFVSKICSVNFSFEEKDLDFTVSVISQDPVHPRYILSSLVQMLRIHDLSVLEQEGNLLITKSKTVRQIPTIVSADLNELPEGNFPLITRVFRIKNANLSTLTNILKPLLSQDALLEVSPETKQLIITDITVNMDKISSLLASIDTPHSSMEIEAYEAKHLSPDALIELAQKIIAPFLEGNPLLFIPQGGTNKIFLVSTAYLIDKAFTILEDLDKAPKAKVSHDSLQNLYLYRLEHLSIEEFSKSKEELIKELKNRKAPAHLIEALQSSRWIQESGSVLFVADEQTIGKLKELIPKLDIATEKAPSQNNFFVYKLAKCTAKEFENALDQFCENLEKAAVPDKSLIEALLSMDYIKESHSFIFTGGKTALSKIAEILPVLDASGSASSELFIYRIQHASKKEIETSLKKLVADLKEAPSPDHALIHMVEEMHYLKELHSLIFTGEASVLERIKTLLPSIDVPYVDENGPRSTLPHEFFVYHPLYRKGEELEKSLKEIGQNLKSSGLAAPSLLQTLSHLKWIKSSQSLVFTGDETSLKQIEQLLHVLDSPQETHGEKSYHPDGKIRDSIPHQFYVYTPKFTPGETLEKSLREMAESLKASGLADPVLLKCIQHMKWTSSTQTLVFSGDATTLQYIQGLLQTLDKPTEEFASVPFSYSPKFASHTDIEKDLEEFHNNLKPKSPKEMELKTALKQVKWLQDSQTFLFNAPPTAIEEIKKLLVAFDTPIDGVSQKKTFSLYKLQNVYGETLVEYLKKTGKELEEARLSDPALLQAIYHCKWIKDGNSILITGTAEAIKQVELLIKDFDQPGLFGEKSLLANKSAFFIYKPIYHPAEQLLHSIQEAGKNLKAAGLIDPYLLEALNAGRCLKETQSLAFTASNETLEKIKVLLSQFDIAAPLNGDIQEFNAQTFLLYPLQTITYQHLEVVVKATIDDLKKKGAINDRVVASLKSMRHIPETNSVLFIGGKDTLEHIKNLISQFDVVPSSPSQEISKIEGLTFSVYTPKHVSGITLIQILQEFKTQIASTGVKDKELFYTIDHLKWIEKTSSLVVSGTSQSIGQTEELLTRFDTPQTGGNSHDAGSVIPVESSNFLVYKLQYHQGEEILSALKQIGPELSAADQSKAPEVLKAIQSLQWLKVTNSLLASGDPHALSKLRSLIQNLDVPLKQVFIEVLVIETNVTNTQNFGLQWGGKVQYLKNFAGGTGNFPLQSANSAQTPGATDNSVLGGNPFPASLGSVSGSNPPSATSMIPFVSGFDLGVIGDVIMHKGKSFLSLGSLVNALETDTDSTIVMNPTMITQDNRNSTLFVGKNVPFVGSLVSAQSTYFQSNQNIEYRDIGFNLSVTPTIGSNDVVTLDISNDISEIIGNTNQGTTGTATQPTGILTSHTTMSTRVHVPDQHFVVLSGMIQESKSRFKSSIPCLGGIPFISALTSEKDRLSNKSNIILFLRPRIINTYEDYKKITESQQNLFKEQAKLPILKEEFDAAIDLIKTPENEADDEEDFLSLKKR